jgi:hypothetical protein
MHYQFEGSLTTRDCKRTISHRFVMPSDSEQVDIHFRFSPHRVHELTNLLTLTLFGPAGFRGAGHRGGASHRVRISAAVATPGYLPGPLPAGAWIVQVDTHMIMPGEALHYRLDVTITEGAGRGIEGPLPPEASVLRAPQRGEGWYRGDLHTHTHHSDAADCTVAGLIQAARDCGLDFVFLTDHNTIAGLAEMDASATGDLLTGAGIELTTFWGHALCLGTREWVDWRVHPGTGGMSRISAETYGNDQVFIIAHPQSVGDPTCTGCRWRYGQMMPGNAQLVEIWNGPWGGDSNNEEALSLWYDWLNQGLRLVATAGTDTHSVRAYAANPGFSVVCAEALSEAALLKALRAGHLYLSAGPQITFEAQNDGGETWIMGDTIAQPVTFMAAWNDCPADAQVRLIANGRLLDHWIAGAHGEREWNLAPYQAHWVVVEIRDRSGGLLAITNPICLG